jgi:hypothetical protein
MRFWKRKGISEFEWGGRSPYKERFGGAPVQYSWLRKSRYAALEALRENARAAYAGRQRLMGILKPMFGRFAGENKLAA